MLPEEGREKRKKNISFIHPGDDGKKRG